MSNAANAADPAVNHADPADADAPLSADERNAMRAYLQRMEVRLSTIHRIAVSFMGGAGLLLLLPIFFKDEFVVVIRLFLSERLPLGTSTGEVLLGAALYITLLYPVLLSVGFPIYALYILFKDVIHFYYTIYTPGFSSNLYTPSFALSGVTFSPDEAPRAKKRILEYQYQHSNSINFAIPFSDADRKSYFDEVITATQGRIIPRSRDYDTLHAQGVLPDHLPRETVDQFNTAFGLARSLDRALVEEVAVTEMSLVRHINYMRRLILRYMKTLLIFIWTTGLTFVMLPLAQDERTPTFAVVSFTYVIWALLIVWIIRMPVRWIYRHRRGVPDERHVDTQLTYLDAHVKPLTRLALLSSIIALVLSVVVYGRMF